MEQQTLFKAGVAGDFLRDRLSDFHIHCIFEAAFHFGPVGGYSDLRDHRSGCL